MTDEQYKISTTRFKFDLGETVNLLDTNNVATIMARGEFLLSPPKYYIEYITPSGKSLTGWFFTEELTKYKL